MAFVVAFELPMLFTLLFFALITRVSFLWVFQGDWPFRKMDSAMYVLSFLLPAILTGLFWSRKPSMWIQDFLEFFQ
jgi:RsiW-degrading membrane proteinase PrsW (M82 family)